jgi:hypothetical protein
MSRTIQFRRLGASTLANTTGANGELIIDSTNQTLTIHDGVTRGGRSLALSAATSNTLNTKLSTTGGTITGNLSVTNTITSSNIISSNTLTGNLFVTNTITSSNIISSNTLTSNNLTVTGIFTVDGVVLQWHTPIPLTSKGDPGDQAGFIAVDNDKLYRCVENYTNGANNIWRFINFTGGTWG